MPKFFVDFRDGDALYKDDEGRDFPNFERARNEALELLPEVARDRLPDGEHRELVAVVRDENGIPLYQASFIFHGEFLT